MFLRQTARSLVGRRGVSCAELVAAKDWTGLAAKLERKPDEPLDSDTLSHVLWTMCAAKKVNLAYQLFLYTSDRPQERHYTALIEGALHANKAVLAANIYYQSQLFGVELDTALYNELLTGLIKARAGLRNVKLICEDMTRLHLCPTAYTCARLLKLAIHMSDWSFATQLLSAMHAHKLEYPRRLLDSTLAVVRQGEDFESFRRLWVSLCSAEEDSELAREEPVKIKLEARRFGDMDSVHLIMTPDSLGVNSKESGTEREDSSHDQDSD